MAIAGGSGWFQRQSVSGQADRQSRQPFERGRPRQPDPLLPQTHPTRQPNRSRWRKGRQMKRWLARSSARAFAGARLTLGGDIILAVEHVREQPCCFRRNPDGRCVIDDGDRTALCVPDHPTFRYLSDRVSHDEKSLGGALGSWEGARPGGFSLAVLSAIDLRSSLCF